MQNIKKFLLPNIDLNTINDLILLCQKYPESCYPMIGLHPCSVKKNYLTVLKQLKKKIKSANFIAIGEIGIDLYWDKTFFEEQKQAFKTQIAWAKKYKIPIVIHCRNAFDEIYKILKEESDDNLRGVLHCFGGSLDQAKKIIDLNFFLGIGGVLTFKNSGLDSVVKKIPLEKIIVEATEQSNRINPPTLEKIQNLKTFLEKNDSKMDLIFTDLNSENKKIEIDKNRKKPVCIIIGPEGDFSEKEREAILDFKYVKSVKINENILRSETAVISSISILSYILNL
mgnify:CR=1 FL=1